MTLQQLKYALEAAVKSSINEAAKSLFISQPSLSNAIKELEKEIKITILFWHYYFCNASLAFYYNK